LAGFSKRPRNEDLFGVAYNGCSNNKTSFEKKQQVVAFIDISGAYDNVLIDILNNILRDLLSERGSSARS
jgi:hypothetical protein